MVEKNYFGSDWSSFFPQTLDLMAEKVFYAPFEIDCSVTPQSQEKFMKFLMAPIETSLMQAVHKLLTN
jgi:hypothetical protein